MKSTCLGKIGETHRGEEGAIPVAGTAGYRSGSFSRLVLLVVLSFTGFAFLTAEDARAREIIGMLDEAETSDGSRTVLRMTVYSDSGVRDGKVFKLLMLTRGGDETFMEIMEPKSVKGLRILSNGDDTWLFFPSTGRIRKIAGSARGDSVQGIGGDFSYEDIGSGTWNETYGFTLLSETEQTWVLEGVPRKSDSVYSKIKITADRELKRPLRIEFTTARDGRFKELEFSGYRDFGGRTAAGTMEMKNLKKGSRTVVETLEADYSKIPDDRYFNPGRFNQ